MKHASWPHFHVIYLIIGINKLKQPLRSEGTICTCGFMTVTMERKDYVVLTGGNSTMLIQGGFVLDDDPLWSARLLKTNHDAIKHVSRRFLDAGSDVILTCTYQASIPGFVQHIPCDPSEAKEILTNGVRIAKQVRDEYLRDRHAETDASTWNSLDKDGPYVVGSIGPRGAHLADGSEYTGNYVDATTVEDLMNWHRATLEVLISEGVDMIAAETIPALKEAIAIAETIKEFPNTKAWISFSVKNSKEISHGEAFSDAAAAILKYPQIVGVGINCTTPLNIEPLLTSIRGLTDKVIAVYPNSGEVWHNNRWNQGIEKVEPLANYVPTWMKLGARWIGGCCRTTPEDIVQVKNAMLTFLDHQALH